MAVSGGVTEKFPAGKPITMTTGAAVTAGRLVKISGADRTVIHATVGSKAVVGVALQTSSASGDKIAVAPLCGGVFSLVAAGAVTRGDNVCAAAAGTVKTATSKVVTTIVDGAAAGNVTVTGIGADDELLSVLRLDVEVDTGTGATGNKIQAAADLTAEFTVTAANTINNAAGTNTTGDRLIVSYRIAAAEAIVGIALASAIDAASVPVLLK